MSYKMKNVNFEEKFLRFDYRFIIHNDKQNPTVSSLEDLDETLKHSEHPPNLFVVSGLQMMDNYPFMPGINFK